MKGGKYIKNSKYPDNKGGTMIQKLHCKTRKFRLRNPILFFSILLTLVTILSLACGVESGNRRSAQTQGQSEEFFRPEVPAFEQFRIDLAKNDAGECTTSEENIQATKGQRIRLAVQLRTEDISQGSSGSIEVTGDRDSVTYQIPGLEIASSGGAFGAGVTSVDLNLQAGTRTNYDFNLANAGTFDVMCDGKKVGTLTVNESSG